MIAINSFKTAVSKSWLWIFLLLAVIPEITTSQIPVDTLQQKFIYYNQAHLQEKLFVHSDKNFYLAGELMWFKIYNVDGSLHLPLAVSKVAYLEIIDFNNQPVLQVKIALDEADGNGFIYLPLHLGSGNYKLRAYTNWMKNYAPEFFFEKPITIINTNTTGLPAPADTVPKYDIQFFPEGGHLVTGIESRLAFKITNQYGRGMSFTGSLINQDNDTVARFKPLKFGIGSFRFTPAKNHAYRTVIHFPGEGIIVKELAAAHDQGYVMSVSEMDGDEVQINIRCNVPAETHLYLLAHTRQLVKAAMTSPLRDGSVSFTIDKKKLGEGISHLTIFNNDLQPVCERLYFRRPDKSLELDINQDKNRYRTREKVNLQVAARGQQGTTDLSVAVYQVDSIDKPEEVDIKSYLWLTSDLKGQIESGAYYLSDSSSESMEACDNLMLTHGWRRFDWQDVLKNKYKTKRFAPEYYGHIIRGKITERAGNNRNNATEAYLSIPESGSRFSSSASDENGIIDFDMKNFYGTSELLVQTNPGADTLSRIEIESPFSTLYTNATYPVLAISPRHQQKLTEHHVAVQVQNVYARNQLSKLTSRIVDTIPFYVKPDFSYNLEDFTRFTTMEEVLREYVKYVFVRKRAGNFSLQLFDIPGNKTFESEPLVLLDGVPVFDGNKVINIDPLKIRKLETVNSKYFFGSSIFEGILSLTSYDANMAGYEFNTNAVKLNYEGLQVKREFYSPQYDTDEKQTSRIPDFRNVLYWSPALKTKSSGVLKESFYTSDRPGRYAIVVQGISDNGNCGSAVTYFEVANQ